VIQVEKCYRTRDLQLVAVHDGHVAAKDLIMLRACRSLSRTRSRSSGDSELEARYTLIILAGRCGQQ
jgi:hypothetical protein